MPIDFTPIEESPTIDFTPIEAEPADAPVVPARIPELRQASEVDALTRAWRRIMEDDPQEKSAAATLAIVHSEAFGINPSSALRLQDTIKRGVKINPIAAMRESTVRQRVEQSWNDGLTTNKSLETAYNFVKDGNTKWLEEAEKLSPSSPEEKYISESRFEDVIRTAAEMTPLTADVMLEGGWKSAVLGMSLGTVAAVSGQPAAIIPATWAGAMIGGTEGIFEASMRKEAGAMALELSRLEDEEGNRLNPNTIRAVSLGVGVINGVLEVAEVKVLLKTIPGFNKLLSKTIAETVTDRTVKKKLADLALLYGKTITNETGIELTQESNNIIFGEITKRVNNELEGTNILPTDANAILQRLYETAQQAAKGFSVIAAPGVVMTGVAELAPKKKITVPEKEVLVKQATEVLTNLGVEPTTAQVQAEDIVNRIEAAKQLFEEKPATEAAPAEALTPEEELLKQENELFMLEAEEALNLDPATKKAIDNLMDEGVELEDITVEMIEAKIASSEQALITEAALTEPSVDASVETPAPKRIITDEMYQEAMKQWKEKTSGKLFSGIDPTTITPLVTMGAYHIESGIKTFAKWSDQMVKDFGKKVKPYLADIWKQSQNYLKAKTTETMKQTIARTTGLEKAPKTITEAQALAASMKKGEQAGKTGFKAGIAEGERRATAETPETMKQRIARITGIKQVSALIREDEALNAAWKKAEQNAKIAFREGKKEGIVKARADMAAIQRRAEVKQAEREKINKDIKNIKEYQEKSKGKIAVEYQEAIRLLLEGIDFKKPTADTLLRLANLHDHIIKNGVPLGISQAELNELGRLSQVSIKDLSPEAISKLAKIVENLYDLGNLKKKLTDTQEGRKQQKVLDSLIASSRSIDPELSGKKEATGGDIDKWSYAHLKTEILHTFRVADDIDGVKDYTGANAKLIKEEMQAEITAKNEANRRSRTLVEKVHEIMKGEGIDEINEDTQARIMINLMAERGAQSQVITLMGKYGFEEVPALDNNERRVMEIVRDTVGGKATDIASVYEKRENLPFPKVENYFPIAYEEESVNIPVSNKIMQDRHRTRQVEQGFTKKTVPGVQEIPRIDFLAIAEENIAAQEWYITMQPVLDRHGALIRTPEYRQAAGQLASSWWKDQVDIVARRGWSASASGNQWLRARRLNLTEAVLGYKVTTIIVQPLAVFDTAAYATGRWGPDAGKDILVEFSGTWINPKAAMAFVKANPALNLRQAGEIAIEETMESLKGKKGVYATYKKHALSGIRTVDVVTAAGAQKGFLKILNKHGVTGVEAEEEAEFLMNLTNGSSEVTIRPHTLSRGEGSRMWFTFQSFFLNQWGLITHDLMKAGYNGTWTRKATALLGLMIIVAGGLAADKEKEIVRRFLGGKEDTESFLKKVILYLPRQLPYVGGLFEFGKAEPPIFQIGQKIGTGTMALGAGKPMAGIEKIAEGILIYKGVPGTVQGFDLLDAAVLNEVKKEEAKRSKDKKSEWP